LDGIASGECIANVSRTVVNLNIGLARGRLSQRLSVQDRTSVNVARLLVRGRVTLVDRILENGLVPAAKEIAMETIAGRISVKGKGLL
jgi:hypothetical protein